MKSRRWQMHWVWILGGAFAALLTGCSDAKRDLGLLPDEPSSAAALTAEQERTRQMQMV